jgi:hypothetical protein
MINDRDMNDLILRLKVSSLLYEIKRTCTLFEIVEMYNNKFGRSYTTMKNESELIKTALLTLKKQHKVKSFEKDGIDVYQYAEWYKIDNNITQNTNNTNNIKIDKITEIVPTQNIVEKRSLGNILNIYKDQDDIIARNKTKRIPETKGVPKINRQLRILDILYDCRDRATIEEIDALYDKKYSEDTRKRNNTVEIAVWHLASDGKIISIEDDKHGSKHVYQHKHWYDLEHKSK